MSPLYRILSVFALLFICINLQAQTCLPTPSGGDDCFNAPMMSCNLDGYVGTSAGYTAGIPPTDFCGLVENDQYFRFIADETTVAIQIVPSNCTTAKGLQAALYETSDCLSLNLVSICASFGFVNTLNVVNYPADVVIGQEYILLIDGFEGDVCDFQINVLQGILSDVKADAGPEELCVGNQITLDGSASSQGTDVRYIWTTANGNIVSGDNSLMPVVDAIGDYKLTVTDISSCCIDEITIAVTENMIFPTFNFDPSYEITCTDQTITLDPVLTNPNDYNFTWSTTTGTISTGAVTNTETLTVSAQGTYNLELEDVNTGCIFDEDVVVGFDNAKPAVTASSTNNLDCNDTETTISAVSTDTGLLYSWEGPNSFVSSSASFMTMSAGTYSVTVTGTNGCTEESSIAVTDTGSPNGTISKERDINCNDLDSKLTASSTTANATYAWSGPTGSLGTNSEITVTAGGEYTLVVSDPNGCSTTIKETVIQDISLPNVTALVSNEIDCNILSATLEGESTTTGALYSWTGPGGFTSSIAQPTVSAGGDYNLVVTGPNGCTDNISVTVIQDVLLPTADAGAVQMLDCNTLSTTIGGASTSTGADFAYEWTSDNATGVLGTDATLLVAAGATYTLEVTNVTNNCKATSSVVISDDFVKPTVDAGPDAFLTCSMRTVVLGGTSSIGSEFTYSWTDALGVEVSDQANHVTTLIGEYTLTISNSINGCVETDMVIVTEDTYSPEAVIEDPDKITCKFPVVTLSSNGSTSGSGIEYAWYNDANALISSNATAQVTDEGIYKLLVTDTNYGCADSILVRVDDSVIPPIGNAGIDMNLDCNTNEVTLLASVSGDLDDFTFEWFDTAGSSIGNTHELTTTTVGRYDLIITDKTNGCTKESFATVNDNNVYPDADAGAAVSITCSDLQVQIGGAGSSTGSNIIHQWYDSSGDVVGNLATINVTISDTYKLVVTNASSSCSAESSVLVSLDQVEPQANAGTAALITCKDPISVLDGSQSIAPNGTLDYEWTASNGAVVSNLAQANINEKGTYTLTVTDTQNGCQNSTTISVAEDKVLPEVMVTNPEIINCYNNFVEVNYTSVNGPISPVWQDQLGNVLSTDESYMATQIGTVVLEATSLSNGCVIMSSIDIIEDKVLPDANIATPAILTCVVKEVELIPTINNFTTEANYTWTDASGQIVGLNSNLTVEDIGDYTLEIQNVDNGCTAQFDANVQEDIEDPVAVIFNTETLVDCYQPSIEINGTLSTGNAALSYKWLNEDQNLLSDQDEFQLMEGGTITLQVTNVVNGCTHEADVLIDEDLEAPQVDFSPVDKLTCIENSVVVQSTVTGAHNVFSYTWTGPDNQGIVSGAATEEIIADTIGDYILVVQDQQNGCESTGIINIEEDRVLPELDIQPVAELNCVTPEVMIDATASSTGANFEYSWSGPRILSDTDIQTIQIDSAGTYELHVVNTITGCENEIQVNVLENTARPVSATLTMEDPTCFGERDGGLDVRDIVGGTAPYLYAINSDVNFTEIATYNNLPAGDYDLIIRDDIGCKWDTVFQIYDPEEVTADLGTDQVIRLGETSELFVSTTGNVISITWTDNGEQGPVDTDFREITPTKTTTYVVEVINAEGCSGVDNIIVEVEDDQRVFIPNSFSPNGDGVNDFFTVFTDVAAFEVSSLKIFDKWGAQVFDKNNFQPNIPELGWDGSWKGKKMQTGSYVYSAFIEFRNGNKINFKGEISIVY